ncbi:hypothetical protein [Streptomyces sp. NBC_01602]|uniref:hypothetical protein n=1 Tax=Streptomyces sp. NBC_01602 TaxID=2975893 RepID=UPI0038649C1F|nr:hypothetical protein OG955_03135 [Streptomyces sp. NBC_01602]
MKRDRDNPAGRATRINFTAVAYAAGASTWLTYASGVREHIEAAKRCQHASAAPAGTVGGTPHARCLWPVGISVLLECQEVFGESGELCCRGVNLGDERCDHDRCLVGRVEAGSRPGSVLIERLDSLVCGLGEGAPFHSPSLLVFTVAG